ncbi:MAG TPA: response regulator [Aquabacterium sp.]|nr:response regulator [Aquabacterium sp.]
MRLLLVEDDRPLAESLSANLRLSGYAVDWFDTCAKANAACAVGSFDAIVLDLNLPDGDGLTLLRRWRDQGIKTPVLILSARDELGDRVQGLDIGADDYLTKPFELQELEARLRVLIRRMQAGMIHNTIEVGPLQLDLGGRRAMLKGEALPLTAKEFAALQALAMKAGQVINKEQLIAKLTDFDQDMSSNALDILIHRLRKKLDGSTVEIRTLRGFGYVLEST